MNPEPLKPDFILGLDLGQSQDYTALASLRRRWVPVEEKPADTEPAARSYFNFRPLPLPKPNRVDLKHACYELVTIKRWPLHTSYVQIVNDIAKWLSKNSQVGCPLLAVDQTGVGKAVVDIFRYAALGVVLRPIVITGGHKIEPGKDGAWHVPKKELVSVLQVLFQARRIQVASMPEQKLLTKELEAFRVKVTASANETFEAWRERDHDDMVLAVALAAWLAERQGRPGLGATGFNPPHLSVLERMQSGESAQARRGLAHYGHQGRRENFTRTDLSGRET